MGPCIAAALLGLTQKNLLLQTESLRRALGDCQLRLPLKSRVSPGGARRLSLWWCIHLKSSCRYFCPRRGFFFSFARVYFVSSPHALLFSLAARPMMLQPWKTAGVIFTGGQGTWVIKHASIFHRQIKNTPPPPTFPVKAQDLCGKFVSLKSVCVRSPPHTTRKHTTCRLRCDVTLGYFSRSCEGNPGGVWNNKQPDCSSGSPRTGNPQHSSPSSELPRPPSSFPPPFSTQTALIFFKNRSGLFHWSVSHCIYDGSFFRLYRSFSGHWVEVFRALVGDIIHPLCSHATGPVHLGWLLPMISQELEDYLGFINVPVHDHLKLLKAGLMASSLQAFLCMCQRFTQLVEKIRFLGVKEANLWGERWPCRTSAKPWKFK